MSDSVNVLSFFRRGLGRFFPEHLGRAITEEIFRRQWASHSLGTLSMPESVRVLFLWIPKTGGSALAAWLRRSNGIAELLNVPRIITFDQSPGPVGAVTFGHQSMASLVRAGILSMEGLSGLQQISLVRNPYARAISSWQYLQKMGFVRGSETLLDFLKMLCARPPRIGLYNQFGLSLACKQSDWLVDENLPFSSRILRLEEVGTWERKVAEEFGLVGRFPAKNRSALDSSKVNLTQQEKLLIEKLYDKDFDFLGYPRTLTK